jgi:tripartite-type tricarboxylate transporter receptor subunit TctC
VVAKSVPDGNTLLFTNSSLSILPVIDPKAAIDPLKLLAPVSMSATYGLGILIGAQSPANTLQEFIQLARKNPGKFSYGSSGPGSGAHFAGEYFKALTGTFIVHVPYKSTAAALTDVAGGVLDLAFDAAARPLVEAGKVKLLAVTDDKRDPRFPNVPTAAEGGLKGFVLSSWVGLLAPAATPAPVLDRLNQAAAAALADPSVRKRFADMGLVPQGGVPAKLRDAMAAEGVLYRKIAADAKLQFE